jgi:phosphohistidine phosphatase
MRLTLLRHGKAVAREDWQGDDADRPLTKDGADQAARVCKLMRPLIRAEQIWTSPWVRARQTAELASSAWKLPLREVEWLAGEALSPEERIERLPQQGEVVLVGHEPDLGILAGRLMGATPLRLKKAGIAVLDGNPSSHEMRLITLVSPKLIQALAEER